MSTLVLTRADVVRHVEALPLLEELRRGFRAYSEERSLRGHKARAPLRAGGSARVSFAGASPDVPAYTVKANARFPLAGAATAVMQLHDSRTGELLAVMEADHLSALRTGLVGAVAADVLARPEASRVAVIGADRQGSIQLKCLRLVRSLKQVWVFDEDPVKREAFAQRIYQTLSLPTWPAKSLEEAVGDAEIVVSATPSRTPFLYPGMLRAGTHVNSFGADEPGRAELSASLIRQSLFFCDDRELAATIGALGNVRLTSAAVTAELGEVLLGEHQGRASPDDVTLFAGVGLPFQDLAMAWATYEDARADESIQRVDFTA